MKRTLVVLCILLLTCIGLEAALGAVGKCTVVKVDGEKMVIECNKETKGFSEGTQIKIKSDRKGTVRGK